MNALARLLLKVIGKEFFSFPICLICLGVFIGLVESQPDKYLTRWLESCYREHKRLSFAGEKMRTDFAIMLCPIVIVMLLPNMLQAEALRLPKSSLEIVRNDIVRQLSIAREKKDQKQLARLQPELDKVEGKIKKFRREWAEYRKRQLQAQKQTDQTSSELGALDEYLATNA